MRSRPAPICAKNFANTKYEKQDYNLKMCAVRKLERVAVSVRLAASDDMSGLK